MVGFSLDTLVGLMIDTGEGSLPGLTLGAHLDTHMNIHIIYMIFLVRCWARLLGGGLALEWSGVSVAAAASRIASKLLAGE